MSFWHNCQQIWIYRLLLETLRFSEGLLVAVILIMTFLNYSQIHAFFQTNKLTMIKNPNKSKSQISDKQRPYKK
jgi:hypothetical protein